MTPTRAVVTLTEGRVDIEVLLRSVAAQAAITQRWESRRPVAELPTPFGNPPSSRSQTGHVLRWNGRVGAEELSFHESVDDRDPVYQAALIADDTLHLFVRLGGTRNLAGGLALCDQIVKIYKVPGNPPMIEQVAFAFVFDADEAVHHPPSERPGESPVQQRTHWFSQAASPLLHGPAPTHGTWVKNLNHPVGLYIWHRHPDEPRGTVEDLLHPLVAEHPEHGPRVAAASSYVNQFVNAPDARLPRRSHRLKAELTIASQVVQAGHGLDGFVRGGPNAPLSSSFFQGALGRQIADFYTSVPW